MVNFDPNISSDFLKFVNSNWMALTKGKYDTTDEESSITFRIVGLVGLIPSIIALPLGAVSILAQHAITCLSPDSSPSSVTVKLLNKLETKNISNNPKAIETDQKVTALISHAQAASASLTIDPNTTTASKTTFAIDTSGKTEKGISFGAKHFYLLGSELGQGGIKIARLVKNIDSNEYLVHAQVKKELKRTHPAFYKTDIAKLNNEIEKMQVFAGEKEFLQVACAVTGKNQTTKGYLMEYCNKGDLLDLVLSGKMTPAQKWDLLETLASGLVKLQAKKIIHYDLKLENIFVKEENGKLKFKIADFGAARTFDEEKTLLDLLPGGTYNYAAPESLLGQNKERTNSDAWSAGFILYTVIFGLFPVHTQTKTSKVSLPDLVIAKGSVSKDKNLVIDARDPNDSIKKLIRDLLNFRADKRPEPQEFLKRVRKLREKKAPFPIAVN